jgi:predicted Zn-dependent protease
MALGEKLHRFLGRTDGVYADAALKRYMQKIGARLAAALPKLTTEHHATDCLPRTWHFYILNVPSITALLLPGGRVYVTRGLLAYLNSEAELAAVFAHEMVHAPVTPDSDENKASRAPPAGRFQPAHPATKAARALQRIRRRSEREEIAADRQAVRLLDLAGYAPQGLHRALVQIGAAKLSRRGRLDAVGKAMQKEIRHRLAALEKTLRKYHLSADARKSAAATRVSASRAAASRAAASRAVAAAAAPTRPKAFVRKLDGLTFGRDPRRGYLATARTYIHPQGGFRFRLPPGWTFRLQQGRLAAGVPAHGVVFQFSASQHPTITAAKDAFLHSQRKTGLLYTHTLKESTMGGFRAITGDFTLKGSARGRVALVQSGGVAYLFFVGGPHKGFARHRSEIDALFESFGPIDKSASLNLKVHVIESVRVKTPTTIADFKGCRPSFVPITYLQRLNAVARTETLKRGRWVKCVTRKIVAHTPSFTAHAQPANGGSTI